MSRRFRALILLVLVAGCGGGGTSYRVPNDLDNACTILAANPSYLRAFRATERRWGVPIAVLMAIIHQESRFVGDARTPFVYTLGVIPAGRQSSAFGYSQALDDTWAEYLRATGSRNQRRDNIRDATNFMGWYMNVSRERNGIALTDARNQYLAYHEGQTGFRRGTYRRKAWLMRVADSVQNRAEIYAVQLPRCS